MSLIGFFILLVMVIFSGEAVPAFTFYYNSPYVLVQIFVS